MGKARILIVDDDGVTVACLAKILSRGGFLYATADDGEKALAMLEADHRGFDALLLDRQMPKMGGLQLLRHLKSSERFQRIPVIFATVMDSLDDIREGMNAGAFYYLVKPLDPRMVLAIVGAATDDFCQQRSIYAEMARTQAAIATLEEGRFRFQTLQAGQELSGLLAKACPDPARVIVGLSELMINAVEHGNLGITYEEKGDLVEEHRWRDEVERRQQRPENQSKWVTVRFQRLADRIRFEIQDAGLGFDWRCYDDLRPELLFSSHGRGIVMAKMSAFDRVEYQGSGNRVVAEVDLGLARGSAITPAGLPSRVPPAPGKP